MTSMRNIKMYVKQKSSITAFCFLFVFVILFLISIIPGLQYKKGVTDEFKKYNVTYITTNNYSVTYLASEDELFYSQDKFQNSSLNDFAGIIDLSNEFGDPTSHRYNFIRIKYDFDSDIVDIKGISDNMIGKDGETFVLTENGKLYLISERSEKVDLLLDDVKKINVKYEETLSKSIYLVLDKYNDLSMYYFENNLLIKTKLYKGNLSDFYYIENSNGAHEILINENNNLYKLNCSISSSGNNEYLLTYAYSIYENTSVFNISKEDLNLSVDKLVELNNKYYYLKDNKVYNLFENKQISCNENINDFYTTGPDALIAKCDSSLYYFGELEDHESSFDKFTSLNIKNGTIYGNRNSLILLKDKKLYLYDKDEFNGMYENYFLTIIIKYLSIFGIVMVTLYIILSFIEDNKRFNRYFKYRNPPKV